MKALRFDRKPTKFAAAALAGRLRAGAGAGVGPLALKDVDEPDPPTGDWVRLRPVLSGICGSDLATIDGRSSRYFEPIVSFPFTPGHEVVGLLVDATPKQRQTAMYSATFSGTVGRLAADLLRDPLRIEASSQTEGHADIEQRLHWADDFEHKNALLDHILTERSMEQAVVFTSTQRDADWLADRLHDMGHSVASLHGGMPQGRRTRVLQGLRSKHLRVLVATDVAARGIDVPTISHVINYGLPMKAEDYVHRIGRTGRAGRAGLAITLAERRDVGMIRRIERFTTQPITTAVIAGFEPKLPEPSATKPAFAGRGRPSFGNRGGFGAPHGGHAAPHGGHFGGHGAPHGGHGGNFGGNFAARSGNGGGFQGDRPFQDRAHGDRPHGGQGGFRDDNRAAAGQFDRGHGSPALPTRSFAGKPPAFGPRRTPR